MPNNVDVDSLSLVMTSDVSSAVRGLNRVDKALKNLIVTYHEGGFEKVRSAISSIAGTDITAGLSNATRASKALATATEKVTFPDTTTTSTTEVVTDAMEREADAFRKTANAASQASNAVNKFADANKKATGKVAKDTKKNTTAALQAVMKFTKKLSFLVEMVKRRILYRAINALISGVANGFKEGVNNLYQWALRVDNIFVHTMDTFATAALYLKNSLGALVSPILNYLAPAIDSLNDKFVDLLNIINRTIAKLSGASSWTKALKYPKSYAEMLDDASGSAKKLKATILGIDEINPLNGQNNGRSGSGDEELDYSKMFEEVQFAEEESSKLGEFFAPLKESYEKYIVPVINKLKTWWSSAQPKFEKIAKDIKAVFTNERLKAFWDAIVGTIGKVFDLFSGIITRITDAVSKSENFKKALGAITDLFNKIIGIGLEETDSVLYILGDMDLTQLIDSAGAFIQQLAEVATVLLDIISLVRLVTRELEKTGLKAIAEYILPTILDILTSIIKVLRGFFTGDWKMMVEGVVSLLGTVVVGALNGIIGVINGLISGVVAAINLVIGAYLKIDKSNKLGWSLIEAPQIAYFSNDWARNFSLGDDDNGAEEEIDLMREQNALLSEIAANSSNTEVTISSSTVSSAMGRANRRNGMLVADLYD